MVAIVSNANNFLLSSDYPLDKAIFLSEQTVAVGAFSYNDVTINHSLGFAPLTQSMWTEDSDWSSAYDENSGPMNTAGIRLVQTGVESTNSTVKLYTTNNRPTSTIVYWRVFGFMPSTATGDVPFTGTADNFALNTGYNYTKLFMSGVTNSSSTTSSTETVTHGLGYRPQVLCWAEESSGITRWVNSFTEPGSSHSCEVDNTTVVFTRPALLGFSVKYHYRIYLDS